MGEKDYSWGAKERCLGRVRIEARYKVRTEVAVPRADSLCNHCNSNRFFVKLHQHHSKVTRYIRTKIKMRITAAREYSGKD